MHKIPSLPLLSALLLSGAFACSQAPRSPTIISAKSGAEGEVDSGDQSSNADAQTNTADNSSSGDAQSSTNTSDQMQASSNDSSSGMNSTSTTTTTTTTMHGNGIGEWEGRKEYGTSENPYKDAPEVSSSKLKGSTQTFTMKGSDSKIFPGNYSRNVKVYFPPNLDKAKEHPFMVSMDAQYWTQPMLNVVDNLIDEKKIPPMIVMYVDNGGGDAEGSERGKEYDLLGPNNGKFLETEVMALVEKDYGVKFSKDPQAGGSFGGSSSGAASFTLAWFYTQRFTKVLSYSATLTAQGRDAAYPKGGYEYGEHIIKDEPTVKPIRVCLEYGENDNNFGDTKSQKISNEMTFKALTDKGYPVRLIYAKGAGHVDQKPLKTTIADNLIWLWQGYPKN